MVFNFKKLIERCSLFSSIFYSSSVEAVLNKSNKVVHLNKDKGKNSVNNPTKVNEGSSSSKSNPDLDKLMNTLRKFYVFTLQPYVVSYFILYYTIYYKI
jgi:hypothetical protein